MEGVNGVKIRKAKLADVDCLVRMSNAGSPDGKQRKSLPETLPLSYFDAFKKIDSAPDNDLMVADLDGQVIGSFHVTYLTYLGGEGREDAQVERMPIDFIDDWVFTIPMKG